MESKIIDIEKYDTLDNIIDVNKYNEQISGFTAGILEYLWNYRREKKNESGYIGISDFISYLNSKNKYLCSNFNNLSEAEVLDNIAEIQLKDYANGRLGLLSLERTLEAACWYLLIDKLKHNEDINFGIIMNHANDHYYALNVRYYNNELYLTWANSLPDYNLRLDKVIPKTASVISKYINKYGEEYGKKVSKIVSLELPYKDTLDQSKIDGKFNCGPCAIINNYNMSIQPNKEFVENIKAKIKKCKECTILKTDDISIKANEENEENKENTAQDKYSSISSLNKSRKPISSLNKSKKIYVSGKEKKNEDNIKKTDNKDLNSKLSEKSNKQNITKNNEFNVISNNLKGTVSPIQPINSSETKKNQNEKIQSIGVNNKSQSLEVNNIINKDNTVLNDNIVSSKTKTLQNEKSQSPSNNTINKDNNINSNLVLNTKKEQEKIDISNYNTNSNVVSKKSIENSEENQQIVSIVKEWKESLATFEKIDNENDITSLIDDDYFMEDIYANIEMYYSKNKDKSLKEKNDYVEEFLSGLKPSNDGNSSRVSNIKKNNNDNGRSI